MRFDDDDYQAWVQRVARHFVADTFVDDRWVGACYPLAERERQWAERAVLEGTFAWAPVEHGLVPSTRALLYELIARPPRTLPFEDTWLGGVRAYLAGAPGRVYTLAPAELTFATAAVAARQLAWEIEGVSVRFPAPPQTGPYR